MCRNCANFPCAREECEIKNGDCKYYKSIVLNISKEIKKDE